MIEIDIPGRQPLSLTTLLLDYNGTIARDGHLMEEVRGRVLSLADRLDIRILTADTFGTVQAECESLGVTIAVFPREGASVFKKEIAEKAGPGVVCVGNGFNDIGMCDAADLSIAVVSSEGMCGALLSHADVLVTSPADALDLLLYPDRLRATQRT